MDAVLAMVSYLRNNGIGLVALFIALGAGAYAAGLPKDSIKSKHIKAGAVKNADLANDAVTSPKVANGSLLGEDFAAGQLPQGQQGERGIQGLQGERGLQGPPGPTFAEVSSANGTPPASWDNALGSSFHVNLPVAGKLFVSAVFDVDTNGGLTTDCSGAANGKYGLYVDGTPIPGTTRDFIDNVAEDYDVTGVTGNLSAGQRTIRIHATCDGASSPVSAQFDGNHSISAVLLGSP